MWLSLMKKPFAAPRTISRIAARRVFQVPGRRRHVVLTLSVPQPVPGSDWGCAVQITGLKTSWSRPRYVFGIDGLQALHLAMQCAAAVLESTDVELEWLGQKGDLGMPRFLPQLPKPYYLHAIGNSLPVLTGVSQGPLCRRLTS
jgi:hypothetical protein